MSGIRRIEFSEASNVKVLAENAKGGEKGMWQEGGGYFGGI